MIADTPAFRAEREALAAFGRRLEADDLAPGMAGNLSVRAGDLAAITPSGVPYPSIEAADICLVRISDGAAQPTAAGPATARKPSTETPMHLAVYRATGARAIVHTHSPFVVALSAVCDELPAVHYAMADLGGPVRVAPYHRFGSGELASAAVTALSGRAAAILRNHGALACGPTLARAYERARILEWLARVYLYTRLAGTPATLSPEALAEVAEAARDIGYGEVEQ